MRGQLQRGDVQWIYEFLLQGLLRQYRAPVWTGKANFKRCRPVPCYYYYCYSWPISFFELRRFSVVCIVEQIPAAASLFIIVRRFLLCAFKNMHVSGIENLLKTDNHWLFCPCYYYVTIQQNFKMNLNKIFRKYCYLWFFSFSTWRQ